MTTLWLENKLTNLHTVITKHRIYVHECSFQSRWQEKLKTHKFHTNWTLLYQSISITIIQKSAPGKCPNSDGRLSYELIAQRIKKHNL